MKNPILKTLLETLESTHSLTVMYLSFLKDIDKRKHLDFNGIKLNSLYWILGHLIDSENDLLLNALGQKGLQHEWLKKFSYGSALDVKCDIPYDELMEIFTQNHKECMNHLKSLNDSDLEKDNFINFKIGDSKSIKTIIIHHIRHIGVHNGHLSSLCKLNGVETF